MNNVFMIIFLTVTIAIAALMISICIAGIIFIFEGIGNVFEEVGVLDVISEFIYKHRKHKDFRKNNKMCQLDRKFNICDTNPNCELEPMKCSFAIEYSTWEEANNGTRKFMCGRDKCKYQK